MSQSASPTNQRRSSARRAREALGGRRVREDDGQTACAAACVWIGRESGLSAAFGKKA
jgi:hypothetical protein